VHCDLKAANVLTTQSDFGVSFNLRAMEREIKDVTGTPNWMARESDVVELEGASMMSDIWSLRCMLIELLTGRPPYGNIGNALTGELVGIWCLFRSLLIRKITRAVMFRIVEDVCPPIPDRFSGPLVVLHEECFQMDPAMRPSAEKLFEHEWLKNDCGLTR
jgi:serine/threonine protein kinase